MTVHSQRSTLIVVAAIIAAGIVAGFLLGGRDTAAASGEIVAPTTSAAASAVAPVRSTQTTTAQVSAAAGPLADAEIARLGEAAMSGPAASRLAAIEQLSQAPREQALPLLKRVLLNGDPATDRPAALQGLRELALAQGDGDQRIRDAVREVIYHGEDQKLASDAQETLDVIAESEMR